MQDIDIGAPSTPPGQVPAPERDERGLWVKHTQHEVTAENLQSALSHVASYLHERGHNMTLVAVGGAVNTMVLQSRRTTHDVDFFTQLLDQPHLAALRDAARYAVDRSDAPLASDWLNNATARMPGVVENIDALVQAAVRQDVVVFERPGLRVLAAPWGYAFVKKVSRIAQGTGRAYDGSDAVTYLHQFITTSNSNQPVAVDRIQRWGETYKALCPEEVLRQVNEGYRKVYGRDGIVFLAGGRA